jgi:hypothetical protein
MEALNTVLGNEKWIGLGIGRLHWWLLGRKEKKRVWNRAKAVGRMMERGKGK